MSEICLSREEFLVLNACYDQSAGRRPVFSDRLLNKALENSAVRESLCQKGLLYERFDMITPEGVRALEPYRVRGAVILAAGPSTRCIPLSLELPKGMFEVKGERLLERQIRQLKEAGVEDITVVVGHKREKLLYLGETFGVRIIENTDYLKKNNIYTLELAAAYLMNAYICSCDDYFEENPFHRYEYESFYAGVHLDRPADEIYVYTDEDSRIVKMDKGKDRGQVLIGQSFWREDFARAFLASAGQGNVADTGALPFWEALVGEQIDHFPPFYYHPYETRQITEFDYFDDLRRFDSAYVKQTHSHIIENILSVFHCDPTEIMDFRYISEGLTNRSFVFRINEVDYIYRHPGDGTEKIVNRQNEKHSLETAKAYGIDPTYVYMDVEQGWKISEYIPEFREPDYADFADSQKVIRVLQKLHSLPVQMDYGLRPVEDAEEISRILEEKTPGSMEEYEPLRRKIDVLYRRTQGDGVKKCFCHGDTYKHNWMIRPDESVLLIDWEYAGFSDPGIDVGYYIVDAMMEPDAAGQFIDCYLAETNTEKRKFHYLAYTAMIAWYWFVWAMYRKSCGADVDEALACWRTMAFRYADFLLSEEG